MPIPPNSDMRFEITTRCNFRCAACPRERLSRKQETMSTELFSSLFDKITRETSQYMTLTFPGMGEPLLDPGLEDKIRYAKSRQPEIAVLILTNGSLLSVERFLQLDSLGVESVRVSLYGHDPETHARAHGISNKALYGQIRSALEEICRLRRKTKLLLTYNVIEGMNDTCLSDWIAHWKDRADLLEVWRPHNWVDGRSYRPVQAAMLPTCGRPEKGPLQVQVDGTVNMCCFDFDGKLTIGDLKTQSLEEIFSSKAFLDIREAHRRGDFSGTGLICASCDQRNKDKSDVAVFNSRFDLKERVNQLSTTYRSMR